MKISGREFFYQLLHYTIGIGVIIVVLSLPAVAALGKAFRSDFSTVAAAIFLLYLIISLAPEKARNILIFAFIAFLFAIPVSGLWGSGQSEQYLIGGILPFSDARFYYMDARRLLEGGQFITGAGRRPLFAALLASLQWMTGQNLFISLALLVIIISLSTYFAAREVHSSENRVAAGFFLVLVFFYIRFLLGKTMSEMLGLPLGLLAFYFIYRSSMKKCSLHFLLGLLLLTLALNARAGAFFVLPVLVIWSVFAFRDTKGINWRLGFLGILTIAAGFAVNMWIFSSLSQPDNTPFGNFSFTLYGLSRGGQSWTLIYEEHPEIFTLPGNQVYDSVYRMAIENIRSDPGQLIKGIAGSYSIFFSLDDYYGSLCWLGGSNALGLATRLAVYFLMCVGVLVSVKNFKKANHALLLLAFLGIILSVAAIPPRDSNHMRVFAATLPFYAMMPVHGLSFLISKIPLFDKNSPDAAPVSAVAPGILGSLLILLMTIFPVLISKTSDKPMPERVDCPAGQVALSFRLLPGNHINIHDPDSLDYEWVPDLKKDNFTKLTHDLPNWELFPVLTGIQDRQILISDLDLNQMQEILLITDQEKLIQGPGIQTVCATFQAEPDLKQFNVYFSK